MSARKENVYDGIRIKKTGNLKTRSDGETEYLNYCVGAQISGYINQILQKSEMFYPGCDEGDEKERYNGGARLMKMKHRSFGAWIRRHEKC